MDTRRYLIINLDNSVISAAAEAPFLSETLLKHITGNLYEGFYGVTNLRPENYSQYIKTKFKDFSKHQFTMAEFREHLTIEKIVMNLSKATNLECMAVVTPDENFLEINSCGSGYLNFLRPHEQTLDQPAPAEDKENDLLDSDNQKVRSRNPQILQIISDVQTKHNDEEKITLDYLDGSAQGCLIAAKNLNYNVLSSFISLNVYLHAAKNNKAPSLVEPLPHLNPQPNEHETSKERRIEKLETHLLSLFRPNKGKPKKHESAPLMSIKVSNLVAEYKQELLTQSHGRMFNNRVTPKGPVGKHRRTGAKDISGQNKSRFGGGRCIIS